MTLLITGATGFVGQAVSARLIAAGKPIKQVIRTHTSTPRYQDALKIAAIDGQTNWREALEGCSNVLHLAARAHVMNDKVADPLMAFRMINTDGTLNLARQAAQAGVRRFVFVSSIKVNGEYSEIGRPFQACDPPNPQDPYGVSKAEAESGLRRIAADTSMEIVIVRPPLVYGPGVKANFERMMRWIYRGVPLPLGAIDKNRRSFVAIENLVDLLITCIDHPDAAQKTFMVSDGEDLSTTDLLLRLGIAMRKPPKLLSIPPGLLNVAAKIVGQSHMAQRLTGNLQADISLTCDILNWKPPLSVDEGLRHAAEGFCP